MTSFKISATKHYAWRILILCSWRFHLKKDWTSAFWIHCFFLRLHFKGFSKVICFSKMIENKHSERRRDLGFEKMENKHCNTILSLKVTSVIYNTAQTFWRHMIFIFFWNVTWLYLNLHVKSVLFYKTGFLLVRNLHKKGESIHNKS